MNVLDTFETYSLGIAVSQFCVKHKLDLGKGYSAQLFPPELKKYAGNGYDALFSVAGRESLYYAKWHGNVVEIGLARVKREEA